MIVYIKNKLMSLAGSSSVKDDQGNDVYKVKGKLKLFSPTRKKKICDMDGNVLYMVRNKFWHFWMPSVFIYEQGQKIAKVKSKLSWGKRTFIVEGYGADIKIEGQSFIGGGLDIIKDGVKVGNIRRNFTIIRDSYILEADEKEMPFMVALVIALDNFSDAMIKES